MSNQSDLLIIYVKNNEFSYELYLINSLNMYEMLRSLDGLPRPKVNELLWHAVRYRDKYNIPRIEYACRVALWRRLPGPPPGDLRKTGQEKTAQEFLDETRRTRPAPAPPVFPPNPPPPGPSVTPQRFCGSRCPVCPNNDKYCTRKFMHYPPQHMCPLGHTW
jgi:hypothetical protein